MEAPRVYGTTQEGVAVAQAIHDSKAGLGFETATARPPDNYPVTFCDFPFTKRTFTFRQHLEIVSHEQPEVAVAPDIEKRRTPEEVYEQADRLAEHADAVVVVPKSIHPSEVPDRFRVGVPMAADFGSDAPWDLTDYAECREVHLLGGGPAWCLSAATEYDLPVASLDTSVPVMVAVNAMQVWAGKWMDVSDHVELYDVIRRSYDNLVVSWREWAGDDSGVYWKPKMTEDQREIRMRSAGYGRPMIAEEDLTALAPHERDEFDAEYSREELDVALNHDDKVVVADFPTLPANQEQANLTTYADAGVAVVTDGGQIEPVDTDADQTITTGREARDALVNELDYTSLMGLVEEFHLDLKGDEEKSEQLLATILTARRKDDVREWLTDHGYSVEGKFAEPDEKPTPKHFSNYREESLKRLEETPHLEPVESFDSVDEMVAAIEEIHVPGYSTPPEKTIKKLRAHFNDLPDDESRRHYLNDYKLGRTINAARRQFNEWVGRKKRFDEMPGWAEAGPARYPKRKHQKLSNSERKAKDELDEKLDRLHGRVKGAYRRALKKAGFSEAELNEQKREATRKETAADLEPGDIVVFRNPNITVGAVVRVNKKTVTVEYPNRFRGGTKPMSDEPQPDTLTTRVDLDSPYLKKLPKDEIVAGDIENESAQEMRDELIETGLLDVSTESEPDDSDSDDETMSSNDDETYDPTDEWSSGQRGLFGGPAAGQAKFDAPARAGESEIESIEEVNEGGLLADTRDTSPDDREATQSALDVGADVLRDQDQGGLDSFSADDEDDADAEDEESIIAADLAENYDPTVTEDEVIHLRSTVTHPEHGTGEITRVTAAGAYVDFGEGTSRRVEMDDLSLATDEPEPESDDEQDADDTPTDAPIMDGETVEFGTLADANEWRDDNPDALGPGDRRITKTVTLRLDLDNEVVENAGNAALASRGDEQKSYEMASLTDAEKDKLARMYDNWTWNKFGIDAMWAKGALQEEGASDWLNYYEPGEGVGSVANLEVGKKAEAETGANTAIRKQRIDSDEVMGERARQAEKVMGEGCETATDYCIEGDPSACGYLMEECGISEDEIEELRDQAFAEWAAKNAPAAEPPTDEELARLAPTPTDDPAELEELPPEALRVLRKAWAGYKLARVEHREANERAEHYAEIINGVRAVNGQDPLTFEQLDGWAGGSVLPDEPDDTFPTDEGQMTMEEAAKRGRLSGRVQATLGSFGKAVGNLYDPTQEF